MLSKKSGYVLTAVIVASMYFFTHVLLDYLFSGLFDVYLRVVINHIIIAAIAVIIVVAVLKSPREWGFNLWNPKRCITMGVLVGMLFGLLFNIFLFSSRVIQWSLHTFIQSLCLTDNIIQLFHQLFIGGTTEEIVFRGILLTMLLRVYTRNIVGINVGVIIVAVIMAGLHFYKIIFSSDIFAILPFAVAGFIYSIALGYLYQKTRSLISPIIAHNLGNTLLLIGRFGMP